MHIYVILKSVCFIERTPLVVYYTFIHSQQQARTRCAVVRVFLNILWWTPITRLSVTLRLHQSFVAQQ